MWPTMPWNISGRKSGTPAAEPSGRGAVGHGVTGAHAGQQRTDLRLRLVVRRLEGGIAYTTLCYAVLPYAMLCYAMLCYAMPGV